MFSDEEVCIPHLPHASYMSVHTPPILP
jgi:hypothetical protein